MIQWVWSLTCNSEVASSIPPHVRGNALVTLAELYYLSLLKVKVKLGAYAVAVHGLNAHVCLTCL